MFSAMLFSVITPSNEIYRFPLFLLQAHAFFHWLQDEIYGTSYAVAYYLKEILKFDKKVFTIGTTGMIQELDELGIPHTGSGVGWMRNIGIRFVHCNSKGTNSHSLDFCVVFSSERVRDWACMPHLLRRRHNFWIIFSIILVSCHKNPEKALFAGGSDPWIILFYVFRAMFCRALKI